MDSTESKSLVKSSNVEDLEMGSKDDMLYSGAGMTDSILRWGFLRKVYGIISIQLALTIVVSSCLAFIPSASNFVLGNVPFQIVTFILPFLTMIPLYIYRHSHPLNLALLGVWTASLSVLVGAVCSATSGLLVVEALVLTAAVVGSLTAYTFYATSKGHDFSQWGSILYSCLLVLLVWGFIQFFFPPGPLSQGIYSLLGALLFSAYIVYDTHMLMKHHSYDEYVWASVNLYLDIINLFLRILRLLQGK
eukprot:jgi/Mesen1/5603/ME000282S04755